MNALGRPCCASCARGATCVRRQAMGSCGCRAPLSGCACRGALGGDTGKVATAVGVLAVAVIGLVVVFPKTWRNMMNAMK